MIFCSTLLLCLLVTFSSVVESAHNNTANELLEWFRSKGGYFNPKQEIRQDSDGSLGVFAALDIEEDELLVSVPWDCVIAAENTYSRFDNCDTVKVLADELSKNVKSPYVRGLEESLQTHAKLLPVSWSPQGKELLLRVTDNGVLPPHDAFMKDFEWKNECERVSKDATFLVLTHGEEIGMSPVTDKYNHAVGKRTGAYFSIYGNDDEVASAFRAIRDIKAGEEIFHNYRVDDPYCFGTPELLKEYGFLESYPQRYVFPDQRIAFDIEEVENDLQVTWLRKVKKTGVKFHVPPNVKDMQFLQEHLNRLRNVLLDLQKLSDDTEATVPKSELRVITQFCSAYMTAMEHAIQSAPVSFDGDDL